MELWKWKYENEIHIFSGEPLLFKSSFTPVYDFGFVGLAVNKVSHHHHQKCVRHGRRHQRYDHLVYDQVYNQHEVRPGVSGRLWGVCGSGDQQIRHRSDGWVRLHHNQYLTTNCHLSSLSASSLSEEQGPLGS